MPTDKNLTIKLKGSVIGFAFFNHGHNTNLQHTFSNQHSDELRRRKELGLMSYSHTKPLDGFKVPDDDNDS